MRVDRCRWALTDSPGADGPPLGVRARARLRAGGGDHPAARRPLHARRRRGAGAGHRALAGAAALAPPRRRPGRRRRRLRQRAVPPSGRGARRRGVVGERRARTGGRGLGARAHHLGAGRPARGGRHGPGARSRASSPCTGTCTSAPTCPPAAATRSPAGWRACCTGTRSRGPRCSRRGPATRSRSRPTCAGSRCCGGGCARSSAPARPSCCPTPLAGLAASPEKVRLPSRVSVYGASRLDTSRLAVLAALAQQREVHLWLNHASPALWETLASRGAPPDLRRRAVPRPPAPAAARLAEPRRAGAAAAARPACRRTRRPPRTGARAGPTLLGRLQPPRRRRRPGASRRAARPGRPLVQVHSCHGRTRQVEVLRDVVLGLLADDPTLEPRDVLVMCPDVETFAPLVSALSSAPSRRRSCGCALADRSPRQPNPLLAVVARCSTSSRAASPPPR